MLTSLRLKSNQTVVFILFGMLIFVFIFFFGPQSQGLTPGGSVSIPTGTAATVYGEKIPAQHVEMAVRRNGEIEREDVPRLRREAIEQLVEQEALAHRARQAGLAVDEKQLLSYVFSPLNPDYQLFVGRSGKVEHERYELYVTQVFGTNSASYLASKERELLAQRYVGFLEQQVRVSEAAAKQAFDEANTSWTLDYVLVDPAIAAADLPEPSEAEGLAYAQAHADEVARAYEANKAQYVHGKEVRVRRVLVKVPADADEKALQAADEKINALLEKVKAAPEQMSEIAQESSEDYFAQMGGDMGWQNEHNSEAGDYQLYSGLALNEISAVQTNAVGKWFVRAEEIKPEVNQSLEQVKGEIGQRLALQAARAQAAKKVAEEILEKAKGGASLAEAIPTKSTPVQGEGEDEGETSQALPIYSLLTSPEIYANRPVFDTFPGIGKSTDLAQALPTLTAEGSLLPAPLALDEGRYAVARLKSYQQPDAEKYAEEKPRIMQALRQQRIAQIFGNWRMALLSPGVQRSLARQFAGGSLMASLPLPGEPGVKIDDSKYPRLTPQ